MKTAGIIFLSVACLLGGLAIGFNLSKGNARQTAISWKYGDAELVIDLDQDLADDETLLNKIFSRNFSEAGAVSWLKESKRIYPYNDPDLIDEIADLDYDSNIGKALRELRDKRQGPWTYQSDTVIISIPSIDVQPARGYCNVCQSKKYRGKTVKLFDLYNSEQTVTLEASGRYECPPGLKTPDIQLNRFDAQELLGFSSFNKYEKAFALIVSD